MKGPSGTRVIHVNVTKLQNESGEAGFNKIIAFGSSHKPKRLNNIFNYNIVKRVDQSLWIA